MAFIPRVSTSAYRYACYNVAAAEPRLRHFVACQSTREFF